MTGQEGGGGMCMQEAARKAAWERMVAADERARTAAILAEEIKVAAEARVAAAELRATQAETRAEEFSNVIRELKGMCQKNQRWFAEKRAENARPEQNNTMRH